ncbi:MAG TPA: Asp-tRNA(Asn)/Glu-tRNA(Gln) amidotransferase subunit GatA [Candidatus Absconditabacterales bacterium]|nr:Asp-tRNA(Asn)/Glu-tRNA(Gln) amidotransferase subunit GatA [Candidatus Absconditabacterales bacterium]
MSKQNLVEEYKNKIENSIKNKENIFLRLENNIECKNPDGILGGMIVGIKDNIMTKGNISSCGSKILANYVAPYTATCIENLQKNGGIVIGKTNMDEFAMGSTNETSFFGTPINPFGTNRVAGGSSGGSAVAVAKDLCMVALGTDTGGSVRQPAAFCGLVGLKPTYGRISRYGVQSMASSLDQVGTFTKTIDDAETLLKAIMGFDPKDSQSDKRADELLKSTKKINEYKIALPKQAFGEGLDPKIKARILEVVEKLRSKGVQIDEIDLPVLEYALPIYYTLMPAEVSTNLSRFDGIRFGLQKNTMDYDNIQDYYSAIRSEGFGEEVKRRILLGSYVLSSSNYEGYYLKAQKARQKLTQDIDNIFQKYDLILTPTTPEVAWKIGEKINDPLKMYLADIYTVPANLAGLPAISIPVGTVEDELADKSGLNFVMEQMPVGLHLMANKWKEDDLFVIGREIERLY